MKDWRKIMKANCVCLLLALVLSVFGVAADARAEYGGESSPVPRCLDSPGAGWSHAIIESLTGDVYAEPSKCGNCAYPPFSRRLDDHGQARRPARRSAAAGLLNAYDGVFYRLGIASYGYANDFGDNGTSKWVCFSSTCPSAAGLSSAPTYLVVSNRGPIGNSYHTGFGDFAITPRVILSETREVTQSLNVSFRTPNRSTSSFQRCGP